MRFKKEMASRVKIFHAGKILFQDGDDAQSLFIIQRGAISLRKKKGKETVEVAKASVGEVIGELSFFDKKPRSATAVAIIEVEVLEISFESFEKIYTTIPDYVKTIVASLATRLRRANEQIIRLQRSLYD